MSEQEKRAENYLSERFLKLSGEVWRDAAEAYHRTPKSDNNFAAFDAARDVIAAALQEAERRGVEKMRDRLLVHLAGYPGEAVGLSNLAVDVIAARLLSEKEDAPPVRRAPSPLVGDAVQLIQQAHMWKTLPDVQWHESAEEWLTRAAAPKGKP